MSRVRQPLSLTSAFASHADYTPMRELSLDELDGLPYAGVALALDSFGAAPPSREVSSSAWDLFKLLPAALCTLSRRALRHAIPPGLPNRVGARASTPLMG